MSYYVYRYIDKKTGIIKYVGISNSEKALDQRVRDHKRDQWYKNGKWRIEYMEVENQSVAEALESHLISLWHTDNWYNKSKSSWGINPYLPTEFADWSLYTKPKKEHPNKHGFSSKSVSEEEQKIYRWWLRFVGDRCEAFKDPNDFYQWVINDSDYSPGLFPIKIDESLEWSPSNIQFTDKRIETIPANTKMITYNGETHSMTEWAKIIGISLQTLSKRISRGHTIEEALSMSPRQYVLST